VTNIHFDFDFETLYYQPLPIALSTALHIVICRTAAGTLLNNAGYDDWATMIEHYESSCSIHSLLGGLNLLENWYKLVE
jgi:hypothetical protein